MGSCVNSTGNRIPDSHSKYDQPILNHPQNNSTRTLQLTLHCLFTKIKIKHCIHYQQLNLKITLAGTEEFELKTKFLIRESVKWEIEHFIELKITEYDLRRQFLCLTVLSIEGKELGTLKINLFLLATGPYHQDFALPLPKSPSTRIAFNLKISQLAKLALAFQQVQLTPRDHEFPGDTYAFALRAILGDKSDETELSQKFVVDFNRPSKSLKYINQHENGAQNTSSRDLGTSMRKPSQKQHRIYWKGDNDGHLPSVEAYVPYYQLEKASFNVVFYLFRQDHKQFFSQCYISYNKIAQHHAEVVHEEGGVSWLVRQVQVELDSWDHGKQAGKARFMFCCKVQSHIRQVKLCVRTEKGILQAGPIFSESKGGANIPPQLEELQNLTNQVQNLFVDTTRTSKSTPTKSQKEKWVNNVTVRLQRQEEILMSSAKESKLMFFYQDRKALLKGQRGLIQLGFRTKDMLSEAQGDITSCCWQVLSSLIRRSQLSLPHMGFTQEELVELQSPSQELKTKLSVAVSYYSLLVDLLQVTLQSFDGYYCDQQKEFAQHFCAYAYFIIPQFRNRVLAAITRPNDPEIEQAGETNLSPSEWIDSMSMKEISLPGRNSFSVMFDWQGSFVRPIAIEQAFATTERRLGELLRGSAWEERMRRRGGAFFAFIRYWVGYVESTAANFQHVDWRYFPGYTKILHSFLAQLKLRPVQQCSQAMSQAAAALLANQKLLSPFVVILFKKTNSNSQTSVAKTVELIHMFFASISKHCDCLPGAFDVKYFLKGVKLILEGESSYAISKALLLIYDHFLLFPQEFRIEIALYLESRVFFKLFLHWCANVRFLFHHILLVRIYHHITLPLSELPPKDQDLHSAHPEYRTQIVFRYKKLLMILDNAEGLQHKLCKHKVDVYEKEMFKKMRNRANQRRRYSSSHSSEEDHERSLMTQLMQPRLDSYSSSEELSRNLSTLLDQVRQSKKDQIITRPKRQSEQRLFHGHGRKRISYFDSHFQSQLVAIKQREIIYVKGALQEYRKVNERFIEYLQRDSQSIPPVSVQLSLDEKELRPQGQFKLEQW